MASKPRDELIPPHGKTWSFTQQQKHSKLPSADVVGKPIQLEDGRILYLAQSKASHPIETCPWMDIFNDKAIPNENEIELIIFDLSTGTIKMRTKIDTNDYKINIQQSVYTKDPKENQIYLINKNKELYTISIETKVKITKITDIDTENHWTDHPSNPQNFASIGTYNDHIVIAGAIPMNTKANTNLNRIHFIPFDMIKSNLHGTKLDIIDFGNEAVIQSVPDKNYILLMGGAIRREYSDTFIVHKDIRYCKIPNNDFKNKEWFGRRPYYLPKEMTSFGMIEINLKKTRYLVVFGGTVRHDQECDEYYSRKIYDTEKSDAVYALYLRKEFENMTGREIEKRIHKYRSRARENILRNIRQAFEQKHLKSSSDHRSLSQDDLYGCHGRWLHLRYKLPEKANYVAFYDRSIDEDNIHLITRDTLHHYTISYQELVDILDPSVMLKIARKRDGRRVYVNGTCTVLMPWTEQYKQIDTVRGKQMEEMEKGRQATRKREIIPFLCPPKYQYEYYKRILYVTALNEIYPSCLIQIILDYAWGDLDETDNNKFYESSVASVFKAILDDMISCGIILNEIEFDCEEVGRYS